MDSSQPLFQFQVNHLSSIHLYLQVERIIRKGIEKGLWHEGAKLPSVRKLSRENSLSAVTIAKAYWQLEKAGFVERVRGAGYFIRAKRKIEP